MTDAVAKDETDSTKTVQEESTEWFLVFDEDTGRDYYFNIETQESLWERPEGMEKCTFRRYEEMEESETEEEAEQENETEEVDEESKEEIQPDGWHYIDMTGVPQGPFQKEQLQEWRAHFPMNTLFWTTTQMKSETEEDKSVKHATFLADILDDHQLLQRWQSETTGHESKIAPSAADYALFLENQFEESSILPNIRQEDDSNVSYADAVLAGLPPEDETVQLADLAKQSGTPLQDIVSFVHAASSDGTTQQLIVTDPYTGKMTAVSSARAEESHQLYGEFGSYIDPAKMEEGLKKSAQYRREKLPSLWMKQVGYKKRTLPWQDERYDRGDYD